MNVAHAIRQYLATQDGPRSIVEISAGIGQARSLRIVRAVGEMCQRKNMVRIGTSRPAIYVLGVPVSDRKTITPEEANRRRSARQRVADKGRRVAKQAKPKFRPVAVPRMRLVASQPAKPAPVPLMSSAEFIAAGGVVEVLPARWNLEIAA